MAIETSPLDYTLNAIRREFITEFPDLTILFITHKTGQYETALNNKKIEILNHPAGQTLWPRLVSYEQNHEYNSEQMGTTTAFAHHEQKRYMNLIKKETFLAVFSINTDNIKIDTNSSFTNKHFAYFLFWQALQIYELFQKNHPDIKIQESILSLPLSKEEWLRQQMMADCFASMMLESKGEKNAIHKILKNRCELCTLPALNYNPEDFPFPVALDAIQLVYKDLKDSAPPKIGLISHTAFMAQEIGQTYDTLSLQQWVTFCNAAQEMAFAGQNKNEILGAAIYTSEDAYIRSTAHIIAETLNIDPVPLKNNDFYNPFTDDESNERVHLKRCRDILNALIEKMNEEENPALILEKAEKINTNLIDGDPIGWCTLPLLDAYTSYIAATTAGKEFPLGIATETFQKTLSKIEWPKIRKLHQLITTEKRKGQKITPEIISNLIDAHDDLAFLKPAFIILTPKNIQGGATAPP